MNPFAANETRLIQTDALTPQRIAIVGAGPAGMAAATTAAERGHQVVLFDAADCIGGQFNIARQIPGKEEFAETLRYFSVRLAQLGVEIRLNERVTARQLVDQGFSTVLVATGIVPRKLDLPGADHVTVLNYLDVLRDKKPVGKRVAIIGAGGIGFDTAEYLVDHNPAEPQSAAEFLAEWGVDLHGSRPGGLAEQASVERPAREIFLLQRKKSKVGGNLGKTTGWIHRTALKQKGVTMLSGVTYDKIDDAGLHLTIAGQSQVLAVDTIVICAGQEPQRQLETDLAALHKAEGLNLTVHRIGGADVAAELDAKRAIKQATELALTL